jgi:hypothetical protein
MAGFLINARGTTMMIEFPITAETVPLLLHHWGCVDASDFPPFNADPASLTGRVVNPDRIVVLAPGQPFDLRPLIA